MKKTKAIIIDIDGTLADIDHRRSLLECSPKKWKEFFNQMSQDKINHWCKELAEAMTLKGLDIILVTGRPEDYREHTIKWLNLNLFKYNNIFFRKKNDFRKDYIIKEEIYNDHIKLNYEILFVVDDRNSVVKMWRRNGLVCLDCAGFESNSN